MLVVLTYVFTTTLLFGFVRCDGEILHFPNYLNHECNRNCTGATPKTCYYDFTFELMYSMNRQCKECLKGNDADCYNEQCLVLNGLQLAVTPVNRLIPGPPIQVCENDKIVARFTNTMAADGLTVHWHGIHQVNSNAMDGVDGVTQCPIIPKAKFTYRIDADQPGTYFYHGHSPNHIATGLFGPLIIHPLNDPNAHLYDYDTYDQIIVINSWWKQSFNDLAARYNDLHYDFNELNSTGVAVNGYGATIHNKVPPPHFKVKKGKRYRFRMINANSAICPVQVTIEKHRMKVISADGFDIQHLDVDTIVTMNGDRVDFILEANQPANSYWMVFKGYEGCDNITSVAVLDYEERTVKLNKKAVAGLRLPCGKALGCYESATYSSCTNYDVVNSADPIDERLLSNDEPDERYYLLMQNSDWVPPQYRGINDDIMSTAVINNISHQMPAVPFLLQDPNNHDFYCNVGDKTECDPNEAVCQCEHVLELGFNRTIELVILNLPDPDGEIESHIMHMHGYSFIVLGIGTTNARTIDELKQADAQGKLLRHFRNGAKKDSIRFPPNGGYGVIRFVSNNPGFWLFHCHIALHFNEGMAVVFKVGDFTAIPPNFPRCGDFDDE